MNKVKLGREAEILVADFYRSKNYNILKMNYCIRGGELDLIAENDKQRIFIEVKLVNHTQHLHEYITHHKITALQRTIQHFQYHYPSDKAIRLDVAFVR
ncbi:YraN family protein [Patescibacteria group bacterium]|nr:YraN family protein [Patescibacteria group bacterium]MBU1758768.1 YraN family protein [Patescibacteria group bacterium]